MSRNKLFHLLSLSTLIVLVLSALFSVPALADSGSTPPGTGTTSGGRTSSKGSALSQLPSGTKVVIVDSAGDKLPLGSQAAQDIVASGDPIWCPSSVGAPVSGMSGCSTSYTDLYALTHAIETGAFVPTLTNSTLWIQASPAVTGQIVLDGSIDTHDAGLRNFTLTIKGGWTGSGGAINTSIPSLISGYGFSITWNNSVIMSNVDDEAAASGQDGIFIYSPKAITLTNVQANHGHEYGAFLNDSNGTGVTITNSDFNYNDFNNDGSSGLYIWSKGPVKVTDTTVDINNQNGAYIDTADFGTAPVTLSGTNMFDGNGLVTGNGLLVISKGAITSGSLDASWNYGYGVLLDNCDWSGLDCLNSAVQPVTLTGTSSFSDNTLGYGLDVWSLGAISVNNVTAVYNGGRGMYLWNGVNSTTPSAIKVTGTNWFEHNSQEGLYAGSYGAISLNNINADYNAIAAGNDGLYAYNEGAHTPQAITLTGNNTMDYNGGTGAELDGTGAITVNNITSACNGFTGGNCSSGGTGGQGLLINNDWFGSPKPQAVTLLGTNNISLNDNTNLAVATYGAIKISNLTADSSLSGDGADLAYGTVAGAVTLTGTNTFDFNYDIGLDVNSNSTISISNLSAVGNAHGDGADLFNYSGTAGVTLSGTNTFDSNDTFGLNVRSNGAITASNLTALLNGNAVSTYGVKLDNQTGTAGVTLTGVNTFGSNYSDGLDIDSRGAITTNNLTASFNGTGYSGADGVYLDNYGASLAPGVSVNGNNTFDNNGNGLYIQSKGAITTNNITANYNANYGADLTNGSAGTGAINVKGTNVFLGNKGGSGLDLYSNSTVSVTHITADNNWYDGLYVSTPGKVTVTCGSFIFNGRSLSEGYGWATDTNVPSIALIGVDSVGNYSGPYFTYSLGTVTTFVPRTCTLP
ncbi:MAG TPA: hypothetical protein VLZ89_00655 [Anaerolineales bacterium]|nr:hypothetical protein [Anaerolineales bacterium]